MNEQKTEEMIQAKGLTAPRLSPELIDAVIVGETFTTLPSGKVMVCELTLRNGFTVRGEASVVSKENFREEIGQKVSRENARRFGSWKGTCFSSGWLRRGGYFRKSFVSSRGDGSKLWCGSCSEVLCIATRADFSVECRSQVTSGMTPCTSGTMSRVEA